MVGSSLPVPGGAAASRAALVSAPVTVSTFNLLCPAYYRLEEGAQTLAHTHANDLLCPHYIVGF